MAAALLAEHLVDNGVEAVVTSAGTHAGIAGVDPETVQAMRERGVDISSHEPRLLDRATVVADGADLIVAMTRVHLRTVAVSAPGAFQRSFTAKELARRTQRLTSIALPEAPTFAAWRAALGEGRLARDLMGEDPDDDVLDPYGQSLAEHRATVRELDGLTATIAHSIAAWHHP